MDNVFAIIPARSGSKAVQHKNIRPLGGRPLLEWSISACLRSQLIHRVFVSTDSSAYAQLAIKLGAEAPFLRPPEISGDFSTDLDFIVHALNCFSEMGVEPDLLVHIRPTTPFRDPRLIDDAIKTFCREPRASALRSVHEMSESAYKTFEISSAGNLKLLNAEKTAIDLANSARQEFPATYQPNGYVDVITPSLVRSKGLMHGDWVIPFVTPLAVEVDTEDDFALLEFLLERNPAITFPLFN